MLLKVPEHYEMRYVRDMVTSIRQYFQTSSPLKPLGQLNSNFILRLLKTRELKFVQMAQVT